MKLKDLRRSHRCIRKRKQKVEKEMEILMGLIDLKVVSRVLRMSDLREEQMHWCEEKMSKVRIVEGKLQRDPSTLFFPAHWPTPLYAKKIKITLIVALMTRLWLQLNILGQAFCKYTKKRRRKVTCGRMVLQIKVNYIYMWGWHGIWRFGKSMKWKERVKAR